VQEKAILLRQGSGGQAWRMSQMSLVRWAMNNAWLEEQGLPSLEKQWCSIRYPDGPKGSKG
jgi:hypothetical protein